MTAKEELTRLLRRNGRKGARRFMETTTAEQRIRWAKRAVRARERKRRAERAMKKSA